MRFKKFGKIFAIGALALGLLIMLDSNIQASELEHVGIFESELNFSEYTQMEPTEIGIQPFCNPVFRVTRRAEFRRTFQGPPSSLTVAAGTTLFSTGSSLSGWWPVTSPGTGAGWVHGNNLTTIAC